MQKLIIYITITFLMQGHLRCYGQSSPCDSLLIARYNDSLKNIPNQIREAGLNYWKGYFTAKAEDIKLPSANNIADSFSLRLWENNMLGRSVIVIQKINKIWEAHKYTYTSALDLKAEIIKPTISITALLERLKAFDFKTMISQYEIPGFTDNIDDGVTYILEIETNDYYNTLIYHCPEHFSKIEANNKKFSDIINLLDKYFSIK